jgi:long-chain acyl-CoA synthetase
VEITFGTLRYQTVAVAGAIGPQGVERFLSILPLNHLYELICGLMTTLRRGASVHYADSLLPDELVARMRAERITSLVGVPLVFRMLQRSIVREVGKRGLLVRAWFAASMQLTALMPLPLRRAWMTPVLKTFGGHLRAAYSGGAPLPPSVARFFLRLGLPIYQGYGLSETGPVIATNTPSANRLGSVGRPLDGVEVQIRDGEICTRGPHVMRGYLDRADLTDQVLDASGWLRTGDLGTLDGDGFLHVTGRAKDLIVLGGGKKVHPDEIEELIAQSLDLAEACVLGAPARSEMLRGSDEVCAVVVPAEHVRGEPHEVRAHCEAEIERLCTRVASFKRPTRVVVRRVPLPRSTNRKVLRRQLVVELSKESK